MDKNLKLNKRFFSTNPEEIDPEKVNFFCGFDKHLKETAIINDRQPHFSLGTQYSFFYGGEEGEKRFNKIIKQAQTYTNDLVFKVNHGDNLYSTWLITYKVSIFEIVTKWLHATSHQMFFVNNDLNEISNNLWELVKAQSVCRKFGITIQE